MQYEINLSKIPYLASFVSFQTKVTDNDKSQLEFVHGPIPLFDVALKGIESGYRNSFRSLTTDLSQYHTLCETYEFLCVDVLGGHSITQIISDLKSGKSDYEMNYNRREEIKGNKSKARDAAFKLLYLILLGEFKDEKKDSDKIFNAVLFLVSHSGTFRARTRTAVRAAYEERFVISMKQKGGLDRWEKTDEGKKFETDDGDLMTEDESPEYYDSDDWE